MSDSGKKGVMQGHDWSAEMGEKWNRYLDQFEGMIEPIGEATLALAAIQAGDHILDIGCGGGVTSLALARTTGSAGTVRGLDISPVLTATATARASQAGLDNVHFSCVDAATAKLPQAGFDVLFSRFGVMFFDDAKAAFKNMHAMLRPGGRVIFCCWGPPPQNPWVGRLSEVLSRHLTMPAPDPEAPGPFAFADQLRTTSILEQAGFTGITFSPWEGELLLGGAGLNAQSATDFAVKAFFVGDALVDQPQDIVDAVLKDVLALFQEHESERGIALQGMAWLVTAQA